MTKEMFKPIHGNIYETPDWLFRTLNEEFNFSYDLACSEDNTKCDHYYTESQDSLLQHWHKLDGWLWLNPPYSLLKRWIEKAQKENALGAKIVVLCPPILTTRYFKQRLPSEIRFIVGRIPFLLDKKEMKSNIHDSCLLIYDTTVRQPLINYIDCTNYRMKWLKEHQTCLKT